MRESDHSPFSSLWCNLVRKDDYDYDDGPISWSSSSHVLSLSFEPHMLVAEHTPILAQKRPDRRFLPTMVSHCTVCRLKMG